MAIFPQGLGNVDQRCNTGERRVLHQLRRCPKGLEFAKVYVPGLQALPMRDESLDEAVRLLYVAMTRATGELVLSAHGGSPVVDRVRDSLAAVTRAFAT